MMVRGSRAFGTLVAAGLVLLAPVAEAGRGAVWADAAQRCFTAIDTGQVIVPGRFGLRVVSEGAGTEWPEQSRGSGLVEIWQGAVDAGGTQRARYCEVRYGAVPGPGEIAEVTGLYADLSARWIDAQGYDVQPARRVRDLGAGLISELQQNEPNPRGCRVAVSFLSVPDVGIVRFSVSEIARAPCGATPWGEE